MIKQGVLFMAALCMVAGLVASVLVVPAWLLLSMGRYLERLSDE